MFAPQPVASSLPHCLEERRHRDQRSMPACFLSQLAGRVEDSGGTGEHSAGVELRARQ